MGSNSQNRDAAAMAIVETADEMEIARSAAPRAYGKLARQRRFRSGGKGGGLFVPHTDPLHSGANLYRIPDPVEGIACHAIDTPYTGGGQNLNK
jgi:hypothetical protein